MKIWIVEGYGGEYEDAREWQIKAFFDRKRAEAYAERLRSGKLVDKVHREHGLDIGEVKYNVFPLPLGDKPKKGTS